MWARRLTYNYLSWIANKATQFGLTGCAFFREDGSIEVIAEGEEENLELFADKLSRGHIFIRIENFSVTWHHPTSEFQDFSIIEKEYNL